jgi:hypothetical protein
MTVVVAMTVTACATVTHSRITDDKADGTATGIRYYNTSPYLIAYSDGKGGLVTEIKYLPDPAKKMSAAPKATLADVGSTMEFDRGVLSSTKDTADATVIPKAIATAIETIGPKLLGVLNDPTPSSELKIPAPHIYKIVVSGNTVEFRGGAGSAGFSVTLLPQEPKEK